MGIIREYQPAAAVVAPIGFYGGRGRAVERSKLEAERAAERAERIREFDATHELAERSLDEKMELAAAQLRWDQRRFYSLQDAAFAQRQQEIEAAAAQQGRAIAATW